MYFLKRLRRSYRHTPGLEWAILKKLPFVLLVGITIPFVAAVANRVWGSQIPSATFTTHVDIATTATALTVGMAGMALAIGCIMVAIMKGVERNADPYPLIEAEQPHAR